MTRLFKREVALTLARPVSGSFTLTEPNAIVVRDLRVQFSIEKNLGSEPNTCTVTVTNMSERTRAEVQRKPLHVRLDAGYDGEPARIFTGDLRWASSVRGSVEWSTTLQLGDGDRASRFARANRSYRAGVDKRTVLQDLAATMGLRLPTSAAEARELGEQFASGISLEGPSMQQIERIVKPHGMTASIQDGQLQILRDGEATTVSAILISQDTGMIGAPELGAPPEKGKPPVLSVRTLLYPGLTPGGRIQVQSRAINGLFRVVRVVHTGDTHGTTWESAVEAHPL